MIKTYGIRITADHPEYGKIIKRREIPAGSKAEATEYARGWCIVQGYGIRSDSFKVETEGMTFRENMTRELRNAGARLSLRYGADVVGPWEPEPAYKGDDPRSIMHVIMPNGWGVSLSSRMFDTFSVDTSMVTGFPDKVEEWVADFSPGVMEYESRIPIGEEWDSEIGDVLTGLAKLPRR